MIRINNKAECCGCGACAQRCPKQCITMQSDNEGFAYPVIDTGQCTNCGLCEKVCPVINQQPERQPISTYAAINSNEVIREQSSSGGIFTLLAEETINKGGIVFGATFNKDWEVEHTFVDNIGDLNKLRGSKYVQSNIGNSYIIAEKFLKNGKEVLFSGTPCQIVGLKRFLRKNYNNLKTVDFVCHGTPSPKVWNIYLEEICSKLSGTMPNGKNSGGFTETLDKNAYMRAFLSNLCLRPSCYHCPARSGKSCSDITLGDLWGAEHICPEIDDDKGLSLVLVKNKDYTLGQCYKKEIEYSKTLKYNPSIATDVVIPNKRNKFFRLVKKNGVCKATQVCTTQSKFEILWNKVIWNIKNRILK